MSSNDDLVAKIGFDTAENGPFKFEIEKRRKMGVCVTERVRQVRIRIRHHLGPRKLSSTFTTPYGHVPPAPQNIPEIALGAPLG